MRRHAVNMSVCARVKNDPESFQRFQDNVHELRALIEQLNAAVGDDQNSLESRKTRLVERVLTYVDFGQRKVPWGASERKARATMHLGMNRLFGPPSYLLTYAPDDVHDPRAIMGGIPFTGRNQFPARTSPDFTKAVQNGARGLSIFEDEETGVRIDTSEAGLQTDPLLWSVTTERPPWLSRIHETHELRARVVDFLRETVGRASIIRFLQYVGFTVQHPDDVIGSDGQIVRQTGSSCGKVAAYNVKLLTEATDWFTESPETFAVSVGDPALKEVASHMKYQRGLYENTDSDQVQHAITQMCGVRDCVRAADTFIQEVVEDLSGLATASDALSLTRLERFRVSNTDTMSGQGLHWIAIAWSAIPKSTTERHPS